MTIHSEHPFAAGPGDRDPLRRFRGRMPSAVSVWTTERAGRRTGWTLSSFLVADGNPGEVVGVLDPDSELADAIRAGENAAGTALVVNLLGWEHRALGDAFAGTAPAPGGPFRLGSWVDSPWGPVLEGSPGWIGARASADPVYAGWGLLIRAVIEHVEVAPDVGAGVLAHVRGRYRAID